MGTAVSTPQDEMAWHVDLTSLLLLHRGRLEACSGAIKILLSLLCVVIVAAAAANNGAV